MPEVVDERLDNLFTRSKTFCSEDGGEESEQQNDDTWFERPAYACKLGLA